MRPILITLLAATLTAALPLHAQTDSFDAAMAQYETGHHAQAYAQLARLADAGHPEAARIAWLMQRHGERLYGQRFEATPLQQLSWQWRLQCGPSCTGPAPAVVTASGC